ncbi:MAG: hypothetical protein ACD_37C00089G0009 [uncultured bacterium]|nr:MAG: hypothetical protein ACD_37C00089G0009 [uncultured bacterium]
MKKISILVVIFLTIFVFSYLLNPFKAPGSDNKTEIVRIYSTSSDAASLELQKAGFIKSFTAFNIAFAIKRKGKGIEPGAYYLSKNMSAWKITEELSDGPDLKEVIVLEGMRKEQIGERLKSVLGWNNDELEKWNTEYTTTKPEYEEGVYFPDTYLIPVNENGKDIAQRMINNFDLKFAPFYGKFAEKDIKWTTAINLASILEREAAGPKDMPLIAGVLWNRLLKNQKLDIDATIQYAIGGKNGKWWPRITGSDIRNTDSRFNTYIYKGLPPHPISNPGLTAIKAVLNPEETDCFYYLHDRSRQIHCSVIYEEHLSNIEKYLN